MKSRAGKSTETECSHSSGEEPSPLRSCCTASNILALKLALGLKRILPRRIASTGAYRTIPRHTAWTTLALHQQTGGIILSH